MPKNVINQPVVGSKMPFPNSFNRFQYSSEKGLTTGLIKKKSIIFL